MLGLEVPNNSVLILVCVEVSDPRLTPSSGRRFQPRRLPGFAVAEICSIVMVGKIVYREMSG